MNLIKWVFLVAILNGDLNVPPAESYSSTSSKCTSEFEKESRRLQERVEKCLKLTNLKETLDRMNQNLNKLNEEHNKLSQKIDKLSKDHYKLRTEFKSKMSYLRSANIAESCLEYFKNLIKLLKPILHFLQGFVARPDA